MKELVNFDGAVIRSGFYNLRGALYRMWKRHKAPPTDTCKHFNGSLQPNFIRDTHTHTNTHMIHPPFASGHQRKAQLSLYVRIFNTNLIKVGLLA